MAIRFVNHKIALELDYLLLVGGAEFAVRDRIGERFQRFRIGWREIASVQREKLGGGVPAEELGRLRGAYGAETDARAAGATEV